MRLWDLPGPKRFAGDVVDRLLNGHNVVASFPGGVPSDFDHVVCSRLGNALRFSRLTATDSPLDDLRSTYAEHPTLVRTTADLCSDAGFRGRLVRPDGLDARTWPAWRDFLSSYAQASRSRALLGRSMFLLAGHPPAVEAPDEVGIVHLTWDGCVDDIDLRLLANEMLRERVGNPLLRSLLAGTVASIAAWDYDCAAMLLAEKDEIILDPVNLLRGVANRKGWTIDTPFDWRLGTASRSGVPHPARAALEDPPTEITRRLWSAQLGVLLPWIEQRRYDVVDRNIYEVKGLMRDAGRQHDDPYEIEIGDLHDLFLNYGRNRQVRKTLQSLRDGRNRLAHRRHLTRHLVVKLVAPPFQS